MERFLLERIWTKFGHGPLGEQPPSYDASQQAMNQNQQQPPYAPGYAQGYAPGYAQGYGTLGGNQPPQYHNAGISSLPYQQQTAIVCFFHDSSDLMKNTV